MKEEENNNQDSNNETSTCPAIEIGMHQNSYNPKKDTEKRGK